MLLLFENLDGEFASNLTTRVLMGLIPILVLIVIFTIAMRLSNRKNKTEKKLKKMLSENDAANLTRFKEIPNHYFFTPILSNLPIHEYTPEEIDATPPTYIWQKKVLDIHDKKMIHFENQYTNIELKNMFGASNLEFIARYEENFTNFIHALRHWAEAHIANNNTAAAQQILEFAVASGSKASRIEKLLQELFQNSP